MLQFERGNIFTEVGAEPIFVTANSFLKKDGSMYMARGASLGCLRRSSGIDMTFGELVKKHGTIATNTYGNKFHRFGIVYDPISMLGAFQVKYHNNDNPDIELIKYSATMLAGIARVIQSPIHLNFPGLGNNTAARPELYKFLEECFRNANVILWRLESKEFEE